MAQSKKIKIDVIKDPKLHSQLEKEIAKKAGISLDIYYAESIKVKDGFWNTSAKSRDQNLTFEKVSSRKGPSQIMTGHSIHHPELVTVKNLTQSIEVLFRRKPIEADILESFKEIIKDMPVIETRPKLPKPKHNGIAGEITTFDAHLAKLAWEQETGYRNYDLNIAIEDYKYVSDKNLDYIAPHNPEIIYYIIGQDMYHMDNMTGNTTGGNHTLDVDGRITKVHNKAFVVSRDNILAASKIAPVEVIWIPGNHDFLASYMLAFSLKQYFRNYKRVTVDVKEHPMKARLWGNLLVGWTHRITGKYNTWSNELAQAWPELWGQSKFREWHHGHLHKKQDVRAVPVFTSGGVLCRQITALSPVDKWHADNVFTDAVPGGESFLWSREQGVFANFTVWTGQYEENRNKLINNK